MRAYFDIVLSDLSYETAVDELAMFAVYEGRVKDHYDIQSASEVTSLEKQTYTHIRQIQRIKAESKQIQTRAKLAQLLNISYEDRPDDVVMPNYKSLFKKSWPSFLIIKKNLQTT